MSAAPLSWWPGRWSQRALDVRVYDQPGRAGKQACGREVGTSTMPGMWTPYPALAAFALLACSATASAATVQGTITSELGEPLAGVTVYAYDLRLGYEIGISGADGGYSIDGLEPGADGQQIWSELDVADTDLQIFKNRYSALIAGSTPSSTNTRPSRSVRHIAMPRSR